MTAALLGAGLLTAALTVGCSSSDSTTPTPTAPASTPTASGTATPSPSPTPPAATGTATAGPAAPTDVVLTGRLPDTQATVTPGEGESGRVTIEWSYAGIADGFRIYQRDCDGNITGTPIEVGAAERMFGPLQPCRPGGEVGVAAYDGSGESEIAWAVPGTAS